MIIIMCGVWSMECGSFCCCCYCCHTFIANRISSFPHVFAGLLICNVFFCDQFWSVRNEYFFSYYVHIRVCVIAVLGRLNRQYNNFLLAKLLTVTFSLFFSFLRCVNAQINIIIKSTSLRGTHWC